MGDIRHQERMLQLLLMLIFFDGGWVWVGGGYLLVGVPNSISFIVYAGTMQWPSVFLQFV
jgi:hypothetical protein